MLGVKCCLSRLKLKSQIPFVFRERREQLMAFSHILSFTTHHHIIAFECASFAKVDFLILGCFPGYVYSTVCKW